MDILYILMLVVFVWSLWLSTSVSRTFKKWDKTQSISGITGAEAARRILEANGVYDVGITTVPGHLTDHYDPRSKMLNLSGAVANNASVSALAVAAHECGHAIQHHEGYGLLSFRNSLVPVANIGSKASIYLFMAGFLFGLPILIPIGIVLYATAVLFHVVTLPVELNASKRAIAMLENGRMIQTEDETRGAKKMLSAAAMTYVAAALTAILQLLRLIARSRD